VGVGHLDIGELGGMGWLLKRVKNKSLMTFQMPRTLIYFIIYKYRGYD
jgi:hypothetical protein